MMAICVNAQVTHNVRVGAGLGSCYCAGCECYREFAALDFVAQYQVNIPFRRGSRFTFSPSLFFGMTENESSVLPFCYVPLTIGYKARLGSSYNKFFFPKMGFALGFDSGTQEGGIAGPTASFDFEISHFVIGASVYYSLITEYVRYSNYSTYSYNPGGVHITLGYKF